MEFKINSSDLLKALSHIHGIVEVRHTLPILSNIILKAIDNELTQDRLFRSGGIAFLSKQ